MREWLSTAQLGKIEGVTGDAIKRRIYAGKYRKVKREPGRGGKACWHISIYDPAVPQDVRDLFERHATKFFGLPAVDDIHRLTGVLEEAVILLRQLNDQLQWVTKRLK